MTVRATIPLSHRRQSERWDSPPAAQLLDRLTRLQQEIHQLERANRQLVDRLAMSQRREQLLQRRLSSTAHPARRRRTDRLTRPLF